MGYGPWGGKGSDMTEVNKRSTAAYLWRLILEN